MIYEKYIYNPLKKARKKEIAKYEQRADYQSIEKMVTKNKTTKVVEGHLMSVMPTADDKLHNQNKNYFGIEAQLENITYTEIQNEMEVHELKFKQYRNQQYRFFKSIDTLTDLRIDAHLKNMELKSKLFEQQQELEHLQQSFNQETVSVNMMKLQRQQQNVMVP